MPPRTLPKSKDGIIYNSEGQGWFSETLFKKKYDKKETLEKDVNKIKKILEGTKSLSFGYDHTGTKIDNQDISERLITYGTPKGYRRDYYTAFWIKVLDDTDLEVKVDFLASNFAMDLISRVSKKFGSLEKKWYFF